MGVFPSKSWITGFFRKNDEVKQPPTYPYVHEHDHADEVRLPLHLMVPISERLATEAHARQARSWKTEELVAEYFHIGDMKHPRKRKRVMRMFRINYPYIFEQLQACEKDPKRIYHFTH